MTRQVQLRHLLPIIPVVIALLMVGVEFVVVRNEHRSAAIGKLETLFHFSASMMAQDLADRGAEGRSGDSLRVLARSATLPHLRHAVLASDLDRIEQATDSRLIGRSLGELDPPLHADLVAEVRQSAAGRIWRDDGRQVLWAVYPVHLPADTIEPGAARSSLVVLLGDWGAVANQSGWEAGRHSLIVLAWALLAILATGLLLKRLLLDRMAHLVAYAESPAASMSAATPPPVSGSDELGRMGARFHSLLEQLASAREDLAHLLDCLPIPLWKTDQQGRCVHVNRAWLEFTGRSRAEAMAAGWDQGYHPDDREHCLSALQTALAAGTACTLEYRMRYRDGTYRWIQDHGEPCHGRGGELRGYIRVCHDIQSIRDSHSALVESEDRFRGLVENSSVGVYLFHEGRLVYGNPRMAALLGCRREDIASIPIFDLFHPNDAPEVARRLERLKAGEEAFASHIFRARRRHGRYGWVAVFGSRIDYKGRHAIIGTVIDVTRRKRAEDSIRKSEEDLRVTLRSIADAVIATDPQGRITLMNPVAESLTGWREPDAKGQPLTRVLRLIDAETGLPVQHASVGDDHAGLVPARQTFLIAPDGTRRPIAHLASPIRPMPEGQITGAVLVLRDETEQHKLMTALRDNEALFRALFEQAAVGVAQIQIDSGRIARVNRRCGAILGRSSAEMVGMSVETMIHPDDLAVYSEHMRQLGSGDAAEFCLEQRWRRPDGTTVWVNAVISSMAAMAESSGHCIAVVEDISLRKKSERALRQFQFMVESAHEEIYLIEPTGALAYANTAAARSLGYSLEDLIELGFPGFDSRCGSDFPAFFASCKEGGSSPVETLHRARDGREVIKELQCSYLTIGDEEYLCGFARDITERKHAEERLRLAGKVFEAARESIVVIDVNRRILAVNPAFTAMTGYTQQDVLGQDARILRSERHGDEFYEELWQSLEHQGVWRGEIWNRRRTGEVCPAMQTIVEVRDESGVLVNYVSVATDITTLKQAEERVRRLAYYDALTGLPNRQLLVERARFALAIEAEKQEQHAVLFLDLDRFKYVNDSLGHQEGDTLLREVALRLRRIVRDPDTLSRLGGDEFVLLLSGVGREGAMQKAENIMQALDSPFEVAGHCFSLTVSIGISLYPHDGTDFETLLRNADTAMYRAKQSGRNTFLFYDAEMNVATLEHLKLMSALRRGVQVGELRTYFQPKVRLSDGHLVGTEALVRWIHPEEGLLMPGHFINAAERSDLIVSIGNWVLEDVCRQLVSWREAGLPPLTVAVNLAPRHFSQPGLADRLRDLLQRYDLDPQCLELELTESTLLEPGEETLLTLEKLKRQGVNLAIDDFGVGYSSLSYLKHLPLASLKIDRSFVRDLTTDSDDRTIAATVVALGHSLGLKVVAEGVESEQQRDILIEQGCDFAQGYLYSRPLSSGDFTTWWRAQIGRVM